MRELPQRLWIGRSGSAAGPWRDVCAAAGVASEPLPLIAQEPLPLPPELADALDQGAGWDWLFVTSARGAERWAEAAGARAWTAVGAVAAVGPATAEAVRRAGGEVALLGPGAGAGPDGQARTAGEALAAAYAALGEPATARLLFAGAEDARPELADALHSAGYTLTRWAAYRTMALPGPAPAPGEPVLLFSPSGVDALRARVADPALHPAVAVGRTTAAAAEAQGFPLAGTLDAPQPEGLAALLRR